jgi:hypothetical protein
MRNAGDWLMVLFLVGIVYILLRPASPAVKFIEALGDFLVTLVRSAADLAAPTEG